jgi:hypothetical protein
MPLTARLEVHPRSYLALLGVLGMTSIGVPFLAIIISQFRMSLGAGIGGLDDLFKVNIKRGWGVERGCEPDAAWWPEWLSRSASSGSWDPR